MPVSCEPDDLAELAKCFEGLSPKQQAAAQILLLCEIANAESFEFFSVIFDGTNDFLSNGPLTGAVDGMQGVLSFFVKAAEGTDGTQMRIFTGSLNAVSGRIYVERRTDNRIDCHFRNAAGTTVARVLTTANAVRYVDGWVNVLFAFDTATDTRQLYINDVSNADSSSGLLNGLANWGTAVWHLGCAEDTSAKWNGLMCLPYFHPTYIDISVTANRRLFINADGSPADMGANGENPLGVVPLGFFNNPVSSWETNLGTGGGFTENGAIGDGGDDLPPCGAVTAIIGFSAPSGAYDGTYQQQSPTAWEQVTPVPDYGMRLVGATWEIFELVSPIPILYTKPASEFPCGNWTVVSAVGPGRASFVNP